MHEYKLYTLKHSLNLPENLCIIKSRNLYCEEDYEMLTMQYTILDIRQTFP